MVLTPTYHVFEMYKGFQEATYLPTEITCKSMNVRRDYNKKDDKSQRNVPLVSASAAKKQDGSIIIALANVSLDKAQDVELSLDGIQAKTVNGRILTCKNITDFNDFEHPDRVKPTVFNGAKLKKGKLTASLPAKSIVVINIK